MMLARRRVGAALGIRARRTHRAGVLTVMLVALIALATACGSSTVAGGFDPPQVGDPAHGAAAQVLISNQGLEIWVGVDSAATVTQLHTNQATGAEQWLIAEIVPDTTHHLGFYFAPGDVTTNDYTAEGIQTTLPQIRADPAYYRKGGVGGFDLWAVMAKVESIAP